MFPVFKCPVFGSALYIPNRIKVFNIFFADSLDATMDNFIKWLHNFCDKLLRGKLSCTKVVYVVVVVFAVTVTVVAPVVVAAVAASFHSTFWRLYVWNCLCLFVCNFCRWVLVWKVLERRNCAWRRSCRSEAKKAVTSVNDPLLKNRKPKPC